MSNELFGEVVKTISLDFAQKTSPVTVFAKQGDNRTRIIHIQPLMNGVPMNIDRSFQYVSKFAAKKPDGHYVYNDSATINDDGTITVTLTDQTLAAHGNAICCIVLETQSGDILTSQNFTLIIEFSAGAYQNLASSDEILDLDDKLDQVQELIDKLKEESKTLPPIAATDANKVLTANEDGTAGWKDPKGNANFIFADSEEELPDPSTVPENTMAFIPQKKAPVLSVNDETPDENGNVQVEVGAKSWNDLADKPFGEEIVSIEWDGNTDGLIEIGGMFKVSEIAPTRDELLGGVFEVIDSSSFDGITETETEIGDTELQEESMGKISFLVVGNGDIYIVPETFTTQGVTVEKGTYFRKDGDADYVSRLNYSVIKKIDPKYLPYDADDIVEQAKEYTDSQRIAYVGLETKVVFGPEMSLLDDAGNTYWTYENPFGLVEGETYTVTTTSGTYAAVCERDEFGLYIRGSTFRYQEYGDSTYAMAKDGTELKIEASVIHKIDSKFLPDSIYTYNSLDDVPNDLPDGVTVLIPKDIVADILMSAHNDRLTWGKQTIEESNRFVSGSAYHVAFEFSDGTNKSYDLTAIRGNTQIIYAGGQYDYINAVYLGNPDVPELMGNIGTESGLLIVQPDDESYLYAHCMSGNDWTPYPDAVRCVITKKDEVGDVVNSDAYIKHEGKLHKVSGNDVEIPEYESPIPEVTKADNGKVLTAKEDGTTEWKELTVPANIVIFNSLDEVPDDLPEGTIVLVPSEE